MATFTDQNGDHWEYSGLGDPAWGPAYAYLLGLTEDLRYLGTLSNDKLGRDICEYMHKTTYQRINLDEEGNAWHVERNDDDKLIVYKVDFTEAHARLTREGKEN